MGTTIKYIIYLCLVLICTDFMIGFINGLFGLSSDHNFLLTTLVASTVFVLHTREEQQNADN